MRIASDGRFSRVVRIIEALNLAHIYRLANHKVKDDLNHHGNPHKDETILTGAWFGPYFGLDDRECGQSGLSYLEIFLLALASHDRGIVHGRDNHAENGRKDMRKDRHILRRLGVSRLAQKIVELLVRLHQVETYKFIATYVMPDEAEGKRILQGLISRMKLSDLILIKEDVYDYGKELKHWFKTFSHALPPDRDVFWFLLFALELGIDMLGLYRALVFVDSTDFGESRNRGKICRSAKPYLSKARTGKGRTLYDLLLQNGIKEDSFQVTAFAVDWLEIEILTEARNPISRFLVQRRCNSHENPHGHDLGYSWDGAIGDALNINAGKVGLDSALEESSSRVWTAPHSEQLERRILRFNFGHNDEMTPPDVTAYVWRKYLLATRSTGEGLGATVELPPVIERELSILEAAATQVG